MKRRDFNKLLSLAGLSTIAPWTTSANAISSGYNGNFYVSIAAIGGWDVTSFCDPKLNVSGERTINTWANSAGISQAGNIPYAEVANNQSFFERFYRDMLVINGIDTQTNSHDDGKRHTWSGRLGFGYPSFGSLVSASIAPDLPLSLVHSNGYSETAGITRFSRLQNPDIIRNLVNDSNVENNGTVYDLFVPEELDLISQFQQQRLERMMLKPGALPRQQRGLNNLYLTNSTRGELEAFAKLLPEQFESDRTRQAAQLAMLAYQSGLCVSCQLGLDGFDTHQNHDGLHFDYLAQLTDLVEYVYDFAEQRGFADKLVVTLGSDFGRRPFYNTSGGKDHWPIGSAIIIKQGASWGNRVVGATDAMHNALRINPQSLLADNSSAGILLEPKHLQQGFRQLAGIENSALAQRFPLQAGAIDLFA